MPAKLLIAARTAPPCLPTSGIHKPALNYQKNVSYHLQEAVCIHNWLLYKTVANTDAMLLMLMLHCPALLLQILMLPVVARREVRQLQMSKCFVIYVVQYDG